MRRSLLGGTWRYALARGLPGLVNFAALAIFTRILSEREYGIFALVVASTSLVYAFGFQWLGLAVLRLLPPAGPARDGFLATVLRLFLLLALIAGVGLLLVLPRTKGDLTLALRLAGIALLITSAWHELNLYLVTAENRPSRYSLFAGVRSVVALLAGTAAALAGWGAVGLTLGGVAGYGTAGTIALVRQWRPALPAAADPAARRTLLVYGLPLAGTFLLDYVVSTSDRLLLGALISPEASGLYAPAYDLCQQALWALMMIVNLAAYPLAIRAVEQGDVAARTRQFNLHFLLLAAIAIPSAAGLAILAPSMSGLLGARFAPAARDLMPIIAVAMLIGGIKSYYFDLSFQLGHATRLQLITVAIAAVANLGLNLLLIPRMGIPGAAWATLVAYVIALVVSRLLGRRALLLPIPWTDLAKVLAAAAGMALALWPLRGYLGVPALVLQVGAGMCAYLGLLLLLNPQQVRPMLLARWQSR